jgi:hypothetical protein
LRYRSDQKGPPGRQQTPINLDFTQTKEQDQSKRAENIEKGRMSFSLTRRENFGRFQPPPLDRPFSLPG